MSEIHMMKTSIIRSITLILLIAALASYSVAQESTTHRKSAPNMSSDGASIRKDFERGEVEWKRYSPEGFGLSFELPGEPFERPYPLTPALQSLIRETKVLDYLEDGLTVNIGNVIFKERVDLKWFAELLKDSLSPKYHSESLQCAKILLTPQGDKFLLTATFTSFGKEGDMHALISGSGHSAWFLSVQMLRGKPNGAATSARIMKSITKP